MSAVDSMSARAAVRREQRVGTSLGSRGGGNRVKWFVLRSGS